MGHACEILTFKENTNKKTIATECTRWGDMNVDPYEHGGECDCGGISPYYTNRMFDTYEEAEKYLESTFGNYRQTAVRYKAPVKPYKRSKTAEKLYEKYKKYNAELNELANKLYYKDSKCKTVRCKHCGATLPTEYCGKSYRNCCPVCNKDLRPQTVINKIHSLNDKKNETNKKLTECEKAEKAKMKQEIYWAVACEVHC